MKPSLLLSLLIAVGIPLHAESEEKTVPIDSFLELLSRKTRVLELAEIRETWQPGYLTMLVEVARFAPNPQTEDAIFELIEDETGVDVWNDPDALYQAVWSQPDEQHPNYAQFKALLYRNIDPRFEEYFADEFSRTIRLDEIRWGGVIRDGIPPLDRPAMLPAKEARYLRDNHVVFGVEINGDARAYPKRILAWHEMFKDIVGGESINGVYCTLCGSMIVYRTEHEGQHHELGTSGFLYRSNKLMYDQATSSMWNTLTGEPVVGPLVGKDIALERLYVVTTTWGEWKKRHPETTVLSLNTGHDRDYDEGAAYRSYFATDELMFDIADGLKDDQLKNKDEVLALRSSGFPEEQLAISADFLKKNPVYQDRLGEEAIVVFTDKSGANRAYESGEHRFQKWDRASTVTDTEGATWTLTEHFLSGPNGERLTRVPAHRAFWFGWHAVYGETRLVK